MTVSHRHPPLQTSTLNFSAFHNSQPAGLSSTLKQTPPSFHCHHGYSKARLYPLTTVALQNRLVRHVSHLFSWSLYERANSAGFSTQKNPDDVVITLAIRTPLTKAKKGGFKDTDLDYMVYALLKKVIEKSKLDPAIVEDVCLGNVRSMAPGPHSLPLTNRLCR